MEEKKNSSKPEIVQLLGAERSYRCPFNIKLPATTLLSHPFTLPSLFSLCLSLIIKFPPTTLLSHSFTLLSLFSSLKNKVDGTTEGDIEAMKIKYEVSL
jgi:hypothetical protein